MSEPIITYDFEFGFLSGAQPLFLSARLGRDQIAMDAERIKVVIHHNDETEEETIIHLQSLSYQRFTKRTLKAEAEEQTVSDLVIGAGV